MEHMHPQPSVKGNSAHQPVFQTPHLSLVVLQPSTLAVHNLQFGTFSGNSATLHLPHLQFTSVLGIFSGNSVTVQLPHLAVHNLQFGIFSGNSATLQLPFNQQLCPATLPIGWGSLTSIREHQEPMNSLPLIAYIPCIANHHLQPSKGIRGQQFRVQFWLKNQLGPKITLVFQIL